MTIRTKIPVLALAVLCAAPCLAQWTTKLPPPNSPYWWTLTDEITPQELRREYRKAAHQERYLAAVEQGKRAPLAPEKLDQLVVFVDGSMTPELNRLPDVLGMLCFKLDVTAQPQRVLEQMTEYSLTGMEIGLVSAACEERTREIDEIQAANAEDVARFVELLGIARQAYSSEEFSRILRTRNFAKLAAVSQYSVSEAKRLSEVWDYEPIPDMDVRMVEFLKSELSSEGWENLRRFLLEKRSPQVNSFELGNETLEYEQ